MSDQDQPKDLFSDQTPASGDTPQSDPVEPTGDAGVNPLDTLVGEGKKFQTVEDLAKGKIESDNFITSLQREMKEMREELNKRLAAEEVVANLERRMTERREPADDERDTPRGSEEDGDRGVDPSLIEKMVEEKITKAQTLSQQRQNLESVKDQLQKKYGSDYTRILEQKMQELGVGKEWANNLAATQPRAFLSLVMDKPQAQPTPTSAPVSQMRTNANVQTGRSYSDFEKLRKEDPSRYFSTEVQMQIHRLAQDDPEGFFNT